MGSVYLPRQDNVVLNNIESGACMERVTAKQESAFTRTSSDSGVKELPNVDVLESHAYSISIDRKPQTIALIFIQIYQLLFFIQGIQSSHLKLLGIILSGKYLLTLGIIK